MTDKKTKLTYNSLWRKSPSTMTADKNLDEILGSVTHLPLKYWRKNFFFMGGLNSTFKALTLGRFPIKAKSKGTHPVFVLRPVTHGTGFEVCPCTSSPWKKSKWINKGTKLLYTGKIMDKTSYLVDQIRFNFPASESLKVRFKGQVAPQDICSIKKGNGHVKK